jgi:hypothetical protein
MKVSGLRQPSKSANYMDEARKAMLLPATREEVCVCLCVCVCVSHASTHTTRLGITHTHMCAHT